MLTVWFYSRQLQRAEKRYSVTELEALSMVSAVKHWLLGFVYRPGLENANTDGLDQKMLILMAFHIRHGLKRRRKRIHKRHEIEMES